MRKTTNETALWEEAHPHHDQVHILCFKCFWAELLN